MSKINEDISIMDSSDGKKKAILTYDAAFLNSDSIFIEYMDVIKAPFFTFMISIQHNETMNILYDISEIEKLSIDELYDWYLKRKNQNVLMSLPLKEGTFEEYFNNDMSIYKRWTESMLYQMIDSKEYYVQENTEMNFSKSLDELTRTKIVKESYIYTPIKSTMIENDIQKRFHGKVKYVYGELSQVLIDNNISNNSTFIFSDVSKIEDLYKAKKLSLSSIAIADRYEYNYESPNTKTPKLDFGKYNKENIIFKLDFFDNIHLN